MEKKYDLYDRDLKLQSILELLRTDKQLRNIYVEEQKEEEEEARKERRNSCLALASVVLAGE